MQLYQAAARIERAEEGDWQKARVLLQNVKAQTDEMPGSPPMPSPMKTLFWWAQANQVPAATSSIDGKSWLARTLKALALNYEGYLDQQQGRYAEALHSYQASAMLQRRLAMAGLAPTLTNLSSTMALMGQFQNARLLAQEAERWARHSGKEYVLALALNARALVETYDNHHRAALRYTEQALNIAEGLRAPRVRGMLLLTRARAQRYLLFAEEDRDHETQALDDALKEANQAVNLLKDNPPDRVTALIERGCMLREMARGHHLQQRETQAVRAARGSQRDLERAAVLAATLDLPDQQALAWTNLGWLWYHSGQPAEAHEILRQVYSVVPSSYVFPAQGGLPPMAQGARKAEACLPFWTILGKAEMLKAYVVLDQAQFALHPGDGEKGVKEAVGHITLALAYNEQLGDEHFDMNQAEASLHRRILQDRLSISALHHCARQVAEELRLEDPTRLQRFLDRMFGPADLWTS
jgi:tetratricopeptide (TPR) repeat protein